ncbi:DUF4369 domain-containing protein [Lutibacter sp. TH_r2]|uniref:DUF4369 domain-containing protein n=1 Tax=Lutibacter sp. TH_r2 TaxID=3082083 RepID=UPI002952E244|nr:DUF4369 domain-containing protein [Lutibacter sp. TH_r2]MDV7185713.1 DUF4369 domain-containing protein [Lutibacter sp. TH_r2]
MKNILKYIIVALLIISCGKSKTGNMTVNGTVKGLKKGTIYLQKMKDTAIVAVDSAFVEGESTFTLVDHVESPEMYYLQLNNSADKIIPFFGEKGEITITTKLEKFEYAAEVKGSKNQEMYDEHKEMIMKFNSKQLDIIKDKFEAQKNDNDSLLNAIKYNEQQLLRRKFYYTVNYAVNHNNSEIAPYLALAELNYANVKLLDTINNSLTKKIKASKYGVALDEFILRIKENEK